MDRGIPREAREYIDDHLTSFQIQQIFAQFTLTCIRNRQVLWHGMLRETAQLWADENGYQTLTTAMGPLMDKKSHLYPGRNMSDNQWTRYIHGASAIFSWYISQGDVVMVLTRPPETRFHPSGNTSLQALEWPIITGQVGNQAVGEVMIVHPAVCQDVYQLWPVDEVAWWVRHHGVHEPGRWRKVKTKKPFDGIRVPAKAKAILVCVHGGQVEDRQEPQRENEVRGKSGQERKRQNIQRRKEEEKRPENERRREQGQKLQNEHDRQLRNLQSTHQTEKDILQRDHATRIKKLDDSHQKKFKTLLKEFNKETEVILDVEPKKSRVRTRKQRNALKTTMEGKWASQRKTELGSLKCQQVTEMGQLCHRQALAKKALVKSLKAEGRQPFLLLLLNNNNNNNNNNKKANGKMEQDVARNGGEQNVENNVLEKTEKSSVQLTRPVQAHVSQPEVVEPENEVESLYADKYVGIGKVIAGLDGVFCCLVPMLYILGLFLSMLRVWIFRV